MIYDLRVATTVQDFQPNGNRGVLVFARADTVNGDTKQPVRWTCQLEKSPRGVVASGGCQRTGF